MKAIRYLLFILLIGVMSLFSPVSVFAEKGESDKSKLKFSISPSDSLFNIHNMKPGDWAPRTLVVKNSGSKELNYTMQLENTGDKKLFNELLMEIKSGNNELYQGKNSKFTALHARKLEAGGEENLDITIRFPEHLGNEFQGLDAAFILKFTAEGKGNSSVPVEVATRGQIGSGDSPSNISKLPQTGTYMQTMLLIGAVFVGVGLILIIIPHYKRMRIAE